MSLRNKNILKDVLQLVFLLLSFIFLGLPIVRLRNAYGEVYDATIFNLMYSFNNSINESLIATAALFVVVLSFVSFMIMIPTLLTTFTNNKEVYKVFKLIKDIMLTLLFIFYGLLFVAFLMLTNYEVIVLGGIYAVILYILISLVVYIFISIKVKVVEETPKEEIEVIDRLTCPNCGASVKEDDIFCIRCGKKLK